MHSMNAAILADVIWKTNGHPNWVSSLRFSPGGISFASGSYSGPAKLWSVSNALLHIFAIPVNDVVTVAFSADGARMFGGGGSGGHRAWRVADGAVFYTRTGPSFGEAAYSPDGTMLALARWQASLVLQHADTGAGIRFVGDDDFLARRVDFSPDNTLLASSGDDSTARYWRVNDGLLVQEFSNHPGPVAFTPDGKYFVMGNTDGTGTFWDVQTNGIARIFPAWGSTVRFSANGKILVTVNGPLVNLWRVATGALLASYDTAPDGNALSLDVSPDARLFAYGTYNGSVVLARMPVTLDTITRTGNETVLNWQGGSGLYQLQANTNFTTNGWQNLGPATTNTVATNVSTATLFFRVQSLPNP